MTQLIAGFLALSTTLCVLEALPDASILLAVLTFMWCVVLEEPYRR